MAARSRSIMNFAYVAARRFERKVAVVTGAGRDIGAATGARLAAEGAAVVLHHNASGDGARALAKDIVTAGGRAVTVEADLSTAEGARAVADAARTLGPEIHAIVHNTGGLVARRALGELDAAFVREVMDLNFMSLVYVAQACAPLLAHGGAIVTLSSQAARDGGGPGAGAYAASKGAVHTFSRSLAKELGPRGVRVNTVAPGMIATGFHDKFTSDEVRAKVAASTLAKREGSADDVAGTIAFLLSDDAAYITGVAVDINGGLAFSA